MKSVHAQMKIGLIVLFAVMAALAAGCRQSRPAQTTATSHGEPERYGGKIDPTATTPSYVVAAPAAEYFPSAPMALSGVAGKTVILDAGHGGHDEGTSHYGLREKDINLDLALRAAAMLRSRGCNVVLTRSADQFIPLAERSAIANQYPNAAFVSVHVNAAPDNPGVRGIETFVLSSEFSDQERSRTATARYRAEGQDAVQGRQALATLVVESRTRGPALAASLQRALCGRLGEADRGVKQKNLAVLRETYFGPAALVEVGFLTNPQTAALMRSDEWRRRTSEALADGIGDFLSRM